eukprot:1141056-Pelagomonas_calceolata.AAC.2
MREKSGCIQHMCVSIFHDETTQLMPARKMDVSCSCMANTQHGSCVTNTQHQGMAGQMRPSNSPPSGCVTEQH